MSPLKKAESTSPWEDIFRLVRRIPRGRVMNYGLVAETLSRPMSARAVGWALHACPDDVPWHRVINASGGISTEALHPVPGLQRTLLESEGVRFNEHGRCSLETYRWVPVRRRKK